MPHRFSEAELEAARNTDLPDLLTSLGCRVKPVGRCHTTAEMDSLRIKNRRTWFRYSEGIGGDAITFLQHFHNKNFPEAMKYLLAWQGHPRGPPLVIEDHTAPVLTVKFTLPSAHTDARRVFAYLRKRGIASQVIQGFLSVGLLYEDAIHYTRKIGGVYEIHKKMYAETHPGHDAYLGFVCTE